MSHGFLVDGCALVAGLERAQGLALVVDARDPLPKVGQLDRAGPIGVQQAAPLAVQLGHRPLGLARMMRRRLHLGAQGPFDDPREGGRLAEHACEHGLEVRVAAPQRVRREW